MPLPDHEIRRLSLREGMISPFREGVRGDGVISYGLSTGGYDCRLGGELLVFKSVHARLHVDPKLFRDRDYVLKVCDRTEPWEGKLILPPLGFALAATVERFRMPPDVQGTCVGKSTYARCGLIVPMTPLEAGWEGVLTVEVFNSGPLPLALYPGEGIFQVIFERLDSPPEQGYAQRGGRYQHQEGVTPARHSVGGGKDAR
jgi:dCTP deaminase